jgi:hypothetical protein
LNTVLSILTDIFTAKILLDEIRHMQILFNFRNETIAKFLLPQAGIHSQSFEFSADQGNLAEILLTQVAEYMEPSLVSQLDCE